MKSNSITRDECISHQKTFMEKLDSLTEDIKEISVSVAKLPEQLAEKFNNRYASKKTEQAVDRVMWLVITAVVIAGLAVVLK